MAQPKRSKIRKLFIANRGEISCRIIRAAREMSIPCVAAFSDADAGSLPVRMADEVAYVGPAEAAKSYLNQDAIIDAAKRFKCDAIHPGYGFLSENAGFADKCRKAGIIFIGPNPENIRDMGDKTVAKEIAKKVGLPVIPGSAGALETLSDVKKQAKKIGFPIILKAAAGGGGRGMRIVREESELAAKFESCVKEAVSAFGNGAIFLEKYIIQPKHVEVQIFADSHGNVVHLGERDCTIQRRHQKLIEEAPSASITQELRLELGENACKLAREAGYLSAGTVEFLLDADMNYYFMEMNTRIQVEHPVTEMITGLDLIKLMIEIAEGKPLNVRQEDIRLSGHSIECRINAEDPSLGFIPTPGTVHEIVFPMGPGVRVDTSMFSGAVIPREYDSMVAKVIVHAANRPKAIARMRRALLELKIGGVRSTAGFHFAIMNDKDFEAGNYDTGYVDKELDRLNQSEFNHPEVAAVATAIEAYMHTVRRVSKTSLTPRRDNGAWKKSSRSHRSPQGF
ncbi:MAG TPA: acetyl-CoA carboxylase biotin carboxylase subunit [bacterium]